MAGYNKYDVKWAFDCAGNGKNMQGFYQGFKLHPIINQDRDIVAASVTKANVHDIQLLKDGAFIQYIKDILIGDKGYAASPSPQNTLSKKGIQLIAKQRKNMDSYLNEYYKQLLCKRKRIESIFGDLKTRFSLILPFLRTAESFIVHTKAAVVTYMLKKIELELLYV